MQFRKTLGLTLLYLGIIILIFGLLAMSLPRLENEQVRMIIASFEAPAVNPVLGFVNQQFLNMIHYSLPLSLVGCGMICLGGILLLLSRRKKTKRPGHTKSVARKERRARPLSFPSAVPSSPSLKDVDEWRASVSPLSLQDGFPIAEPAPFFIEPKTKAPPPQPLGPADNNPYLSYGQSAYAPPSKRKKAQSLVHDSSDSENTALPSQPHAPYTREAAAAIHPTPIAEQPKVSDTPLSAAQPTYFPTTEPTEAVRVSSEPIAIPKHPLAGKPALSAANPLLVPEAGAPSTPATGDPSTVKISQKPPLTLHAAGAASAAGLSAENSPTVPSKGSRTSRSRRQPTRIRSTVGKGG